MELGTRIRMIRKRMRLTQEVVASACGFTKGLLSKIENSRTMPAVSTLTRIAEALKVPVSSLLDESPSAGTVKIPASALSKDQFIMTDRGYSFFAFAKQRPDKKIQPFMFEVEKGKVKPQALTHSGEEFIYILKGTVNYRVGDVTHILREGDSLYFDAEEEHEVMPVTKKAKYLAVFTEAALQKERK